MNFHTASETILKFFERSQVRKTASVWEKITDSDNLKWVLSLQNLNWGDTIIIHTKFILKTKANKSELLKKQFSYLYDMNCQYRFVDFETEKDLKQKLENIILNQEFGTNLKELSRFLANPTILLNEKLFKEGIENHSIFNFDYDPHYAIMPCDIISFDFKFDVDNVYKIALNLKKEKDQDFEYRFQFDEKFDSVSVKDLSNIEGVIYQYLKKNIFQPDSDD